MENSNIEALLILTMKSLDELKGNKTNEDKYTIDVRIPYTAVNAKIERVSIKEIHKEIRQLYDKIKSLEDEIGELDEFLKGGLIQTKKKSIGHYKRHLKYWQSQKDKLINQIIDQ